MNLLRIINLLAALWGIVLIMLVNRRYPGFWVYAFPIMLWLLHVAAFLLATILRNAEIIQIEILLLNLWSSAVRLHILFTFIFIGTLLLLRGEDA